MIARRSFGTTAIRRRTMTERPLRAQSRTLRHVSATAAWGPRRGRSDDPEVHRRTPRRRKHHGRTTRSVPVSVTRPDEGSAEGFESRGQDPHSRSHEERALASGEGIGMTLIPGPKTQIRLIPNPIHDLASRDSRHLHSIKIRGCAEMACFPWIAQKTQFRPNSATESESDE